MKPTSITTPSVYLRFRKWTAKAQSTSPSPNSRRGAGHLAIRRTRLPILGIALIVGFLVLSYLPAQADETPSTDPIFIGAGDIAACTIKGSVQTAKLIDAVLADPLVNPANVTVFTAGDNAYEDGSPQQFNDCYKPTWGRFLDRTRPAPGNHDYKLARAAGYFGYFGKAAGPVGRGYYSYDLGTWHMIALDSDIDGRVEGSQGKWLQADLAATKQPCILAYWHHPLFATAIYPDRPRDVGAFWKLLYQYHASVVVNGHIHAYERFAPQTPDGTPDPDNGIRQFIVGTGGASLQPKLLPGAIKNSEIQDHSTWGVIKFTLHASSYDWEFIPVAGSTFTDSGTGSCVNRTPTTVG